MQEAEDFSADIGAVFLPLSGETGDGVDAALLSDIATLVLLQRARCLVKQTDSMPESKPDRTDNHKVAGFDGLVSVFHAQLNKWLRGLGIWSRWRRNRR